VMPQASAHSWFSSWFWQPPPTICSWLNGFREGSPAR
jgi:hypothetical protein